MPAIPIVSAVVGIAGGVSQINANNKANKLTNEQFGLQKQQYQDKLTSANNWQKYVDQTYKPISYTQALDQAETQLNPLYEEEMTNTLNNVNNGLMSRGFFGQAPGAALTQTAASKVAQAKAQALGTQANNLYNNSLAQNLAAKQMGLSNFGYYGG